MRARELLLIGVLLGLLVGLVLIYVYPSATSYSVVNRGDEGLSILRDLFNASVSVDLSRLRVAEPSRTAYLIIRSSSITPGEVRELTYFLSEGGYVVASGDSEFVGSIAGYLNLSVGFESGIVYDMIYNEVDRFHPIGFSSYCNTTVITYRPYRITAGDSDVLAYSSNFSYVDLDVDGYMDVSEPLGPFPLAVSVSVGQGRLIFVSSPWVFTNKLVNINEAFLRCVLSGRDLIIDQAGVKDNLLEYLRISSNAQETGYYMLACLTTVLSLVIYYVFREG